MQQGQEYLEVICVRFRRLDRPTRLASFHLPRNQIIFLFAATGSAQSSFQQLRNDHTLFLMNTAAQEGFPDPRHGPNVPSHPRIQTAGLAAAQVSESPASHPAQILWCKLSL